MDLADKRKRLDFSKRFCERLKEWQKEGHRTQQDFCAAAGVSKNTVTDWKKGRRYPQDAQMMKICEVFEVDPRALAPYWNLEKNTIDNSVCIEWSRNLQIYADEKGLTDEFYNYFVSKPNFIRDFPFHQRSFMPFMGFDPVKFQFMDDKRNMIMLRTEDIDFLIELQNRSDNTIDYMLYRKRQKMDRERIERLIDIELVFYAVDRAEVLKRLYEVDFAKTNKYIEDKTVTKVVEQIAKEKGIKPNRLPKHFLIDLFVNNSEHDQEWIDSTREWGRIYGKEEEAEKIIKICLDMDKEHAAEAVESYRKKGLLLEED